MTGKEAEAAPSGTRDGIGIPLGAGGVLEADLEIPPGARGLVVFAHGSGSGRHSQRNERVASALREAGFGTLLVDLLTEAEREIDRETSARRFDIELLAQRLARAFDEMIARYPGLAPAGCFGASTGAAAALVAASRRRSEVGAVVSRGGRPDLAGGALDRVQCPTLLLVGSRDRVIHGANRGARRRLPPGSRLRFVRGATHLFEEAGTLEEVGREAASWFTRHLARGGMEFEDRRQAGRVLARRLRSLAGSPGLVVLALPRGGVPVGFEVARALRAPLDVLGVRKVAAAADEDFALGAVGSGGIRIAIPDRLSRFREDPDDFAARADREAESIATREKSYRGDRLPLTLAGRTALLIDDGLATGSTMIAAVAVSRSLGAARVIVASPVASAEARGRLESVADEGVWLSGNPRGEPVSLFYRDFGEVADDEVRELLRPAPVEPGSFREPPEDGPVFPRKPRPVWRAGWRRAAEWLRRGAGG